MNTKRLLVGEQYEGFFVYNADFEADAYGPFRTEAEAVAKARELVSTADYEGYDIFVSRVY